MKQLNLTDRDLALLYRAVLFARDSAFLATGSKSHRTVRTWEELRNKIKKVKDL